ncbi:MAG: glycosyltransferase family 2 protein [Bacteroidales bacterium]|nr:glycosyltransferase family 2 protein [Bacteroidales bacterium]
MEDEVWRSLVNWADFIIFFIFLCSVGYLFIFAVSSLKNQKNVYRKAKKQYRYLVVFTTHQIDDRIYKSVNSFLDQNFPKDLYKIVIACRSLTESDKQKLNDLPVTVVTCQIGDPSRAIMFESVLKQMDSNYDVIVVMKQGNSVDPNFLEEINKAYYSGGMAIQTHRILKNPKTNTAILNAVSEEINNSIFRRGHVRMGFSAGLIGSGMAFNYIWFKNNITKVVHEGLTKQLEAILLKQGVFIEYLEKVYTYDEKGGSVSAFNKQRQDWYSTKRYTLRDAAKDFPKALLAGNFDFCDKIIQWLLPSRFILLVNICIIAIALIFFDWTLSIKWFILLLILLLVFDLSIPSRYRNARTMIALIAFPLLFLSTLMNTLKIRGNR